MIKRLLFLLLLPFVILIWLILFVLSISTFIPRFVIFAQGGSDTFILLDMMNESKWIKWVGELGELGDYK